MAEATSWPGYAPHAETVAQSRREFVSLVRSFWLIPELIPKLSRDDLALLYCVCRRLDDDVDEAASPEQARAALERWRAELFGQAQPRPLVAAFLAGVTRNRLPLECAAHLLDGMESDLGQVRIADDDELVRYAYRVSAAVGLMVAPLIGWEGVDAEHRIVDLGVALQISNVLLGVREDASRGRVYLPRQRLEAAGLLAEDVLAAPAHPRLRPVLAGLADLGDRYYRSATLGAALAPLRYRHGILLFGRIYGELGRRASRGAQPPRSPSALPLLQKTLSLVEILATAWHPRTLGLLRPPPHDPTLHLALGEWRGAHGFNPQGFHVSFGAR